MAFMIALVNNGKARAVLQWSVLMMDFLHDLYKINMDNNDKL